MIKTDIIVCSVCRKTVHYHVDGRCEECINVKASCSNCRKWKLVRWKTDLGVCREDISKHFEDDVCNKHSFK